jgi:hypothetical protein
VELSSERGRLPEAIAERVLALPDPIYLSIDKDVLGVETVATNWDQGIMTGDELLRSIALLRARIFAADVTGEISFFRYSRWWKRALARLDGQAPEPPADLEGLRRDHAALNERIVDHVTAPT